MEQLRMPLFNLGVSEQERNRALIQVTQNAGPEFMASGLAAIASLKGQEMTGEEIREILLQRGIIPHHFNAWGALIMTAVRQGKLVSSGKLAKSRNKTSHARKAMVYLCQ